jgi:hypothetical protein
MLWLGFGGAVSSGPFSISQVDSTVGSGSGSISKSCSIGAVPGATERRYIIVCSGAINGSDATPVEISGVTIGGSAATILKKHFHDGGTDSAACGIAMLEVAAGTTATIVASFTTVCDSRGFVVYRLITGTGGCSTLETQSDTGRVRTLSLQSGKAVVACGMNRNGDSNTWVGLTENFDSDTNSADHLTTASLIPASSSLLTVTVTSHNAGNNHVGVSVSLT